MLKRPRNRRHRQTLQRISHPHRSPRRQHQLSSRQRARPQRTSHLPIVQTPEPDSHRPPTQQYHHRQSRLHPGKHVQEQEAAEGSCTIGDNLPINAGGTSVLRYGNTRALCLGLAVVTTKDDILHGLRKNNTGYDLRDLYIGAEGTLGIITAAALKIFPQPQVQLTALKKDIGGSANPSRCTTAAEPGETALRRAMLTDFELMSDLCLQLVAEHFPQLPFPFAECHPKYMFMELSESKPAPMQTRYWKP